MTEPLPVTLEDIRTAARTIKGQVLRTPMRHSRTLSEIAGCDIYLKFENLQFTASFKERGALNRLLALSPEEAQARRRRHERGQSCPGRRLSRRTAGHSRHHRDAGDRAFHQGQAHARFRRQRDPGRQRSETKPMSRRAASPIATGLTFIHPYDDAKVIAGQGTLGLEMLEDVPELDTLVVPVGGGGLISGIAVAAKALKAGHRDLWRPGRTLSGDAPGDAWTNRSPKTRRPRPSPKASRSSSRARSPPPSSRRWWRTFCWSSEAAMEHALAMILEIEKTVIEGAAAAGFAAVLKNPALFKGRKVGIVMSGGNIDMRMLSNVILRELSREGRILTLDVAIDDQPGALSRVAALVGEAGGNILEVSHNRMMSGLSAKSATLGMVIEARDAQHAAEIRDGLEKGGFPVLTSRRQADRH